MSVEVIKAIREAEERAEEIKRSARQQARDIVKQSREEAEEITREASVQNARRMQEVVEKAQQEAQAELKTMEEQGLLEIDAMVAGAGGRLDDAAAYILDQIGDTYGDR